MLPSGKRQWIRLFALPFVTYTLGIAIFYPYWRMNVPGRKMYINLQLTISIGCLISSLVLFIVGFIQLWVKDRKVVLWNIMVACIALIYGYLAYLLAPSLK